jgi:hypothetical protein
LLTFQREESIAKRRNFNPSAEDEEEIESDDEAEMGGSSLSDHLPQYLQAVYSEDVNAQLDATTKFRK